MFLFKYFFYPLKLIHAVHCLINAILRKSTSELNIILLNLVGHVCLCTLFRECLKYYTIILESIS